MELGRAQAPTKKQEGGGAIWPIRPPERQTMQLAHHPQTNVGKTREGLHARGEIVFYRASLPALPVTPTHAEGD